MIHEENLRLLSQLVFAMDEAIEKLEEAYNSKDIEKIKKIKKFLLSSKKEVDKIINISLK